MAPALENDPSSLKLGAILRCDVNSFIVLKVRKQIGCQVGAFVV